jgi:hypothetical protein
MAESRDLSSQDYSPVLDPTSDNPEQDWAGSSQIHRSSQVSRYSIELEARAEGRFICVVSKALDQLSDAASNEHGFEKAWMADVRLARVARSP